MWCAIVGARGSHGLVCRRSAGRQACHAQVNDTIHRALVRAGVPSTREPVGLMRSGDQRLDGCTLEMWERGKCLSWDVTIPGTHAQSHLSDTSVVARAAAERATKMKHDKYQELTCSFEFCAVAIETYWAPLTRRVRAFRQIWATACRLCRAIRWIGDGFPFSASISII